MGNHPLATESQQPTFEDLERLVEVSQLLTLHDLNDVMEEVMRLSASAVGADRASLFLHNGNTVDWNHIFTARSLDGADSVRVVSTVFDEGLAGWVVRNRQAAVVADTQTDDRWHIFPEDPNSVRSAICVPLMDRDEVVAVLTVHHGTTNHFNDYHMRLLTIIANQAMIAIRNAQLFQRVREKQQQLETVLQSVPDVLLVTNNAGELIVLNDGATALLGLDEPTAAGQPLADFTHIDIIEDLLGRICDDGELLDDLSLSFEARAHQTERDYVVNVSSWAEPQSSRRGAVIIMHDVTTLRDLFRFKDEILRIVSHDLRSPLAIIRGYVDMLEYDIPDGAEAFEFTEAIRRSITRMNNLLEDLLKVRQIDEKGLHLETDAVLLDLVRPVFQGAVMLTHQKEQTIEADFQIDDTVRGTVDTTLLRQAMENYVSNAVKYTPEGGHLIVRAYVADGQFYYEVQDNGIGIPQDSLTHLFESFYRVNPTRDTTISGAGLGLSLVKSIVERHKGHVWVKSEEGKGSTFGMCVPI